ncbi:S8 family peptidase [Planococcus salinus]|uniref:SLH domain-containing protein n=1 Tax=Planococcus salinus TaxID=1848460 RepID=A0A3M8P8I3_9BACL|nr:S8 family serine peptidase [Planococcus salinus]RNF39987.1 hypothetical protein EEX84_04930 [Planococcus salinus]
MKRYAMILFLFALLVGPSQIYAEETHTYLVYASEEQLEEIKKQFQDVATHFEELPLVEVELNDSEKQALQQQFSSAEVYPNRQYETAADVVSPSFGIIKSTPKETSPYTGKGVRVAVLDTGIDTDHPDLKIKGGVCTAAVCSQGVSYDDNFGHGTHVAGILAAQKNNSGIMGVAPGVDLFAIKAMNEKGAGSTAQITKGVEWAIQNDIDILNLSISISVNDRPLELMLQKAYEQGMLIVSAAGNEGSLVEGNSITYPGKFSSVIAVGAVNANLTKEQNSSIGAELEMVAPGTQIYSTYPKELDEWDDRQDGYRKMTGTSMAAPHVTGVLALYQEQYPGLSNKKLRTYIQNTAKDLGLPGRDEQFGYGLLQYQKQITTMPYVQAAINQGGIQLQVKNQQLASNWSLSEGDTLIPETAPGEWELYKTAGTYSFKFAYTDQQGKKVTEVLKLDVKQPAFPDVTMNAWYAPHISYLYSHDMMKGYTDGTFKPRKEITRAEALTLIGRAQGLSSKQRNTRFTDVSFNNSASGYIQSAYEAGIIDGFPDGSFKPYQSVTRAEMAILIQNTYRFDYDDTKQMAFKDVHSRMASYEAIQALTQQDIARGVSSAYFDPVSYMNRFSFSVFMARAENQNLFQ